MHLPSIRVQVTFNFSSNDQMQWVTLIESALAALLRQYSAVIASDAGFFWHNKLPRQRDRFLSALEAASIVATKFHSAGEGEMLSALSIASRESEEMFPLVHVTRRGCRSLELEIRFYQLDQRRRERLKEAIDSVPTNDAISICTAVFPFSDEKRG